MKCSATTASCRESIRTCRYSFMASVSQPLSRDISESSATQATPRARSARCTTGRRKLAVRAVGARERTHRKRRPRGLLHARTGSRQPTASATCTCTPGIEQRASGRADSSPPSSRVPESWASPRISQRLGRHTIALSSPITSFKATSGKRQLEKASSWRGRRPRAPDPTQRATWEGDGRSV